ncbi:MAG: hypothetical protein IPP29_16895 [Bacteroidetes bacterium]|nr:hypothetical protein [Bacteroidota bacterium]
MPPNKGHEAPPAAPPPSAIGTAVAVANTALDVYDKVKGAQAAIMGATGKLAETSCYCCFSN